MLEEHCLAIAGEKILEILPAAEARQRHPEAVLTELSRHLLIPGLVDTHSHATLHLARAVSRQEPPLRTAPGAAPWLESDFAEDAAALAMAAMLRAGSTCCGDMGPFPEATARSAKQAGLRARIFLPLTEEQTPWAQNGEDCLQKGLQLRDEQLDNPLLHFGFGLPAPESLSRNLLQRIGVINAELNEPVQAVMKREGAAAFLQELHRLDLNSPLLQCVHLPEMTDKELYLLAESGCHVICCPRSDEERGQPSWPLPRLLEQGINVALGSDGLQSQNAPEILGEMRAAALTAGPKSPLSPHRILEMATLGGAKALGLGDEIGCLEPGRQADMVAVDLGRPGTWPVYEPLAQLVYAASPEQVSHVWVAGRPLLEAGRLTQTDPDMLMARCEQRQHDSRGAVQ